LKKPTPSTIIDRYCSASSFTPQFSRRTPRLFPTINNLLPSMPSIYRHKSMEAALGKEPPNTGEYCPTAEEDLGYLSAVSGRMVEQWAKVLLVTGSGGWIPVSL
jgi:hypothetical protein